MIAAADPSAAPRARGHARAAPRPPSSPERGPDQPLLAAAWPDIRRPEIPIRRTGQEKILRDVSGLAPDGVAAGAMVIGRVGERREHLPAHPERGFTVRHLLPGARERQAQSPQPREWLRHLHAATGITPPPCARSMPSMVQRARRWRLVKMLRCKGLRGGTGCITHDFFARLAGASVGRGCREPGALRIVRGAAGPGAGRAFGIVTSIRGLPLGVRGELQACSALRARHRRARGRFQGTRRSAIRGCRSAGWLRRGVPSTTASFTTSGVGPPNVARGTVSLGAAATRFEWGGAAPADWQRIDDVRARHPVRGDQKPEQALVVVRSRAGKLPANSACRSIPRPSS